MFLSGGWRERWCRCDDVSWSFHPECLQDRELAFSFRRGVSRRFGFGHSRWSKRKRTAGQKTQTRVGASHLLNRQRLTKNDCVVFPSHYRNRLKNLACDHWSRWFVTTHWTASEPLMKCSAVDAMKLIDSSHSPLCSMDSLLAYFRPFAQDGVLWNFEAGERGDVVA